MPSDHHLLLYDYVPEIADRRAPHREAHLARIAAYREEGRIVMAGALGDPPHGAALVFRGLSREEIEEFVRDDPYVEAELVTKWYIERWNLV
jgi:uncharacterized protein